MTTVSSEGLDIDQEEIEDHDGPRLAYLEYLEEAERERAMDFAQVAKDLMNRINLPRENEEEYQKDIESALVKAYMEGRNDAFKGERP